MSDGVVCTRPRALALVVQLCGQKGHVRRKIREAFIALGVNIDLDRPRSEIRYMHCQVVRK